MSQFDSEPMPIPSWMVIDAARYAMGRMSYQVSETCDWLVANWALLPDHAKQIIQQDLEEAFHRDNAARSRGSEYLPLGMDCDRRQWERVRSLYRVIP